MIMELAGAAIMVWFFGWLTVQVNGWREDREAARRLKVVEAEYKEWEAEVTALSVRLGIPRDLCYDTEGYYFKRAIAEEARRLQGAKGLEGTGGTR